MGSALDIHQPPERRRDPAGGHDDEDDVKPTPPTIEAGRENLHRAIAPDAAYEGRHRWDPDAAWSPAEERRVVLKTDLRLLTCLCLMFFALQLDRGNLSNALADNLLDDLGMTTDDYNNGTTIQLVFFLAAEFPMQFVIKRHGFRTVLPVMVILWSTVSWAQAFMTNKSAFYATRALIGLCEGGFIPGVVLMATYYYTSRELSVRLAAFWSTLNIARVISALLAAGLLEMRGVTGRPGWFWLFLVEGLLTLVIGAASLLYLPRSPTATASALCPRPWYSEREEVIVVNRILRDDPAKGLTALKEPATWQDLKNAWTDKSLWALYFIGLVAYIPATPVQAYLSLTLKRIGFSTFASNMLAAPSAGLQVLTMLALAWSSDRLFGGGERALHCLAGEAWLVPLLAALLTLPDGGREWERFSLITLVSGYPYFHPLVSSWISENTFDVKKRATAAATYNVLVQLGSLAGSQVYRSWDAPYYKVGNRVCVALACVSVAAFLAQRWYLARLNAEKAGRWDAMSPAERAAYQGDTAARLAEGNKRLDFRFQY